MPTISPALIIAFVIGVTVGFLLLIAVTIFDHKHT